jgi:hypothetical protein
VARALGGGHISDALVESVVLARISIESELDRVAQGVGRLDDCGNRREWHRGGLGGRVLAWI